MNSPLLSRIMQGAGQASERLDVPELQRFSALAKRVQDIETQIARLTSELHAIEESFPNSAEQTRPTGTPTVTPTVAPTNATGREGLRITIDWSAAGVGRERAVIQEHKVSETLISFFAEVHAALGNEALIKLAGLRVSRGPIVSQNPNRDYVNGNTGAIYTHHPIPGTSFFVITHSSTPEKVDAVREVARVLGFTSSVVKVERV